MISLAQASLYFDRTPITNPDTGAVLFYGQIDPYDDSKRDSSAAYRRVLSVGAEVTVPQGGAVRALGQTWLVGGEELDGYDEIHRKKYLLMAATSRVKVSSLGQYLRGEFELDTWAEPVWVKDAKQLEVSSQQPQIYDVFLAGTTDQRSVVWGGGRAFLTLSVRPLPSGLTAAHSLRLDHDTETVSVISRAYDPVAGAYDETVEETVEALQVRWQSLFDYGSQAEERYQEGDASWVVPAEAQVTTSDVLQTVAGRWQVLAVDALEDSLSLHCRRL